MNGHDLAVVDAGTRVRPSRTASSRSLPVWCTTSMAPTLLRGARDRGGTRSFSAAAPWLPPSTRTRRGARPRRRYGVRLEAGTQRDAVEARLVSAEVPRRLGPRHVRTRANGASRRLARPSVLFGSRIASGTRRAHARERRRARGVAADAQHRARPEASDQPVAWRIAFAATSAPRIARAGPPPFIGSTSSSSSA